MSHHRTWNIRTGDHAHEYRVVDGERVAIWEEYDGPDFRGYFKASADGEVGSATKSEYQAWRKASA